MSAALSHHVGERPSPRLARKPSQSGAQTRTTDARVYATLIERVAAGDEAAFAELYDAFSRPAYGVALRILRESGLAEDAVQEAFLAAWRTAHRFQAERGSAATWILTLVHRRAVDAVRRRQHRRAQPLDEAAGEPAGSADVDAIERDRVHAALASLNQREREVIGLAYYGGLTQSEIAAELGTALGTVKSRTFNGLKRLEQALTAP